MSYYQRVGLVEEGKPISQQGDDAEGEHSLSMHVQSSSSNFSSASISSRHQNGDEEDKRHMATLEVEYQKAMAQEGCNGEHGLLWDSEKTAGIGIGKQIQDRSEYMQGAFQSEVDINRSSLSKASSLSSQAHKYAATRKHPKKKMVTSFVIGGANANTNAKAKTHASALYDNNNNNLVMEVDHENNDHYHHHHQESNSNDLSQPQHFGTMTLPEIPLQTPAFANNGISNYEYTNAGAIAANQVHLNHMNMYHQEQQQHQQQKENGNIMNEGIDEKEYENYNSTSERMEIDEVYLTKLPLVVLDGANVAYAYSQATGGMPNSSLSSSMYGGQGCHGKRQIEPNCLGIQIAVSYFINAGCRVQVVIPLYWMRKKKPQQYSHHTGTGGTDSVPTNSAYEYGTITQQQQIEILQNLQAQGILCCSPPTDDDDAYCIAIARRIDGKFRETRSQIQSQHFSPKNDERPHFSNTNDLTLLGGAYIVSNDLYRDAMARDSSGNLRKWLEGSKHGRRSHDHGNNLRGKLSESVDDLPRRISYSFCDLGSIDKYGDVQLDFVPNPRHALIGMIERSDNKL